MNLFKDGLVFQGNKIRNCRIFGVSETRHSNTVRSLCLSNSFLHIASACVFPYNWTTSASLIHIAGNTLYFSFSHRIKNEVIKSNNAKEWGQSEISKARVWNTVSESVSHCMNLRMLTVTVQLEEEFQTVVLGEENPVGVYHKHS